MYRRITGGVVPPLSLFHTAELTGYDFCLQFAGVRSEYSHVSTTVSSERLRQREIPLNLVIWQCCKLVTSL